ncbi:MAG: DUF1186 domain-containing protein [Saprospiraceae bacterium]|nr:DUF1186 domain-containing protein [Saprospiraceae bacterium]
MLNIRFSPLIYTDAIEEVLNSADLKVNDPILAAKLAEVPHFHYENILAKENPKQFNKVLEKASHLFPDFIWFRQLNGGDMVDQFKPEVFYKIYGEEMACIEDDFLLSYLMNDEDMEDLIGFVSSFYLENGMTEKLTSLYQKLEDTSFGMAKFEVAMALLDDDNAYDPFLEEIDGVSYRWLMECLENPIFNDVDNRPLNDIMYTFLNANMGSTIFSKAQEIDKISFSEKDIESDVKWLLKQGLYRAMRSDFIINLDFFIFAFYLTAVFKLRSLYPFFVERFVCVKDETRYHLCGDFANEILSPAFQTLFDDELPQNLYAALKSGDDELWFSKSVILNGLGSLVKQRGSEHASHHFLKSLFESYINDEDEEMINWCFNPIEEYGIAGFEEEFERAYEAGFIHEELFGSKEDILDSLGYRNPIPLLPTFSSLIEYSVDSFMDEAQEYDPHKRAKSFMKPFLEHAFEDDENNGDAAYSTPIIPMFGNTPIVNSEPKIGRNDPCPCGSGKKYKKCCGKSN